MTATRLTGVVLVSVVIAAAAVAWVYQQGDTPSPVTGDVSEFALLQAQVAALTEELQAERMERLDLQEQVTQLHRRLRSPAPSVAQNSAIPESMENLQQEPALPIPPQQTQVETLSGFPGLLRERAEELGLEESELAYFQQQIDQVALDEMYIRDQAAREGWQRGGRYREELLSVRERTREQLGEDQYDAFLYVSGRTNRLQVDAAMANSPAAQVGLQPGDLILSYEGERVYDLRGLQQLQRAGEPGVQTQVEIQRGDEVMLVYLPRGPIGVRLSSVARPPT